MTGMEQEIVKPDNPPKTASQAFSPLGCLLAASGVTLLVLCKLGAAMAVSVWAFSKLLGFPEWMMFALMALGAVPVLWATVWTAGRAWHVERRLAQHLDIDTPVFKLGHYFRKA
jgi:hypothetical protein